MNTSPSDNRPPSAGDERSNPGWDVEFLEDLVESIPAGVLVVSPEGKIRFFNQQFKEMWKLPRQLSQAGSDTNALQWTADQTADPEAFLTHATELKPGAGQATQGELAMKDGRILHGRNAPLRSKGVFCGWVWTFSDVTNRKEAENAMKRTMLAAQLACGQQRKRKRLATLLHDDLQHVLMAAKMQLKTVAPRIHGDSPKQAIDQTIGWISRAATTLRGLIQEQMTPPSLHENGLLAALEWLAARMWRRYELRVVIGSETRFGTLKNSTRSLLFECIRELLFNVAEYARVDVATASVVEEKEGLRITVQDEGEGFDVEAVQPTLVSGVGLINIRKQIVALGGTMTLNSRVGHGTCVQLFIPAAKAMTSQCLAKQQAPTQNDKP